MGTAREGPSTRTRVTVEHRPAEPASLGPQGKQSDRNLISFPLLPGGLADTTGQSGLCPRKLEETRSDPGPGDLVDREDRLPGKNKLPRRGEIIWTARNGKRRPGRQWTFGRMQPSAPTVQPSAPQAVLADYWIAC